MAGLVLAHPDWSLAKCAREAGYSESEYYHAAREVFERKGTQQALAELRQTYRDKLSSKFSVDDAVDGLVSIAKEGQLEFAKLNAINTILEHLGVVEPKDRVTIINAVVTQYNTELMPILTDILTPEQGATLAERLSAITGRIGRPERPAIPVAVEAARETVAA